MRKTQSQVLADLELAKCFWPSATEMQLSQLQALISSHGLCTTDVQLLDDRWYITHSGLLHVARKNRCNGIHTEAVSEFCDPAANRWVVRATVFTTPRSKGFVGYGDADPSNVSPLVHGAEMRVAETRAVNRALRKAYGIGMCSVEELENGSCHSNSLHTESGSQRARPHGKSSLRDRLLLLIRQHQLDSEQVKLYAANFCGTPSLREASREQIEHFVDHLTRLAADGREHVISRIKASLGQDREVAKTDPEPKEEQAA
jgi:hypothetical protein